MECPVTTTRIPCRGRPCVHPLAINDVSLRKKTPRVRDSKPGAPLRIRRTRRTHVRHVVSGYKKFSPKLASPADENAKSSWSPAAWKLIEKSLRNLARASIHYTRKFVLTVKCFHDRSLPTSQ